MANYRLAELDFDEIKTNLKQFLINYRDSSGELIFKDYDFDASSLSVLLDLLSYNTHYNAYFANMIANEMFLDSAIKRESAVSIAKHLGYTPLSYRSARAKVSFTITNPEGNPGSLTLPKYSPFSTSINNIQYTFVNLDSVTIKPANGVYTFNDVEIVEGTPLTYSYRVDLSGPEEKYSIPNKNIDTSTIRVTVQNSYTNLGTENYTLAQNFEGLTSTSKVFFLEENASGFYEIFFGDNVLGKKLVSGNIVRIEYLVSNGSDCNVSSTIEQRFSLGVPVGGATLGSSIVAVQNSTGGDIADSLDEIKFKAPRFLSSFNRAVTANDYKAIIEANYPLVESVSAWGSEENDPPTYGKVYVSLKPYSGFTVNTELKNRIIADILNQKKILGITPEFVDPVYLYVNIDSQIKFDSKNSRYTASQIETFTLAKIQEYFSVELQKFDKDFVYSKLTKSIDSIGDFIVGNKINLKIQRRITPRISADETYAGTTTIKFANKLVSNSIQSTGFYYRKADGTISSVYLKDTLTSASTNNISMYDLYDDSLIVNNIGTINYNTGVLSIPILKIAGYLEDTNDIRIYAKPEDVDIQVTKDMILIMDDSKLNSLAKRSSGASVNVTIV